MVCCCLETNRQANMDLIMWSLACNYTLDMFWWVFISSKKMWRWRERWFLCRSQWPCEDTWLLARPLLPHSFLDGTFCFGPVMLDINHDIVSLCFLFPRKKHTTRLWQVDRSDPYRSRSTTHILVPGASKVQTGVGGQLVLFCSASVRLIDT